MKIYNRVEYVVDGIGKVGGWLGACCCFALMILIVVAVVSRLSWQGLSGSIDITESLMVAVAAMLLAYTQTKRGHINVEFVTERLPTQTQKVLSLIVSILILAFMVFLVWQSWKQGLFALEIKDHSSSPPYVPYYPAKLALALGVSLFGLQLVVDTWRNIKNLLPGGETESGTAA